MKKNKLNKNFTLTIDYDIEKKLKLNICYFVDDNMHVKSYLIYDVMSDKKLFEIVQKVMQEENLI